MSKTFNLLAVGCPLLAISNVDTEMYRMISKYHNGRCIAKTRIDEIVAYISVLKENVDYLLQVNIEQFKEAFTDFINKFVVEENKQRLKDTLNIFNWD